MSPYQISVIYFRFSRAAVAQLDRVLGYEPRGRGFDSCQPHQIEQGFTSSGVNPFSFAPARGLLPKIYSMKNCSFISLLLVMVLSLMGCATPVAKPAFYPNAHYQHMGAAQAQADAHACADLANQSDVNAINKMDAARVGAAGAAGVATAGAVGSVLKGNKPNVKNIAAGAVALGAGGAAATAAGQSVGGSNLYRQFVQQCLTERGYQVIGWH